MKAHANGIAVESPAPPPAPSAAPKPPTVEAEDELPDITEANVDTFSQEVSHSESRNQPNTDDC